MSDAMNFEGMSGRPKVAIIGAGFAGLSAAAYLAAAGYSVQVFERHGEPGGRARQLKTEEGYTFDRGPSWYWMPDVFDRFFADFGYRAGDWYRLKLLDPAFELVLPGNESMAIPHDFGKLRELFESREAGAAARLDKFMRLAQYKYEEAMESVIYKPGLSVGELLDPRLFAAAGRFQLFSSIRRQVGRHFRHPHLVALMEFPILFLGAMPADTPALYTLMNYAGLRLGTWYPDGGFASVAQAMARLAEQLGAEFHYRAPVESIVTTGKRVSALVVNGEEIAFDAIVAAADYRYVEQELLPPTSRNYDSAYWDKKTFAPSSLIFYLGLTRRFDRLLHHTLFFDEDLEQHARDIFREPAWPERPLFYVSRTSATDAGVAPAGHDNLFLLMPIAGGLSDTPAMRERYFHLMMDRLEKHAGTAIRPFIAYKSSYCINEFIDDYGAYKGNAYGLANTLAQTAIFKPKIVNRHLGNLVYAGQLTVPGPGVPPAIISGKIAAGLLKNWLGRNFV